MRKSSMIKTIFSCYLIFSGFFVLAQETYKTDYKIKYEVIYSMDSTHVEKTTTETVYLFSGSDYGVFMNYNEAHKEERIADYEKQMRKQRGQSSVSYKDNISRETNFNSMFFKDLKSDSILTVSPFINQHFSYPEPEVPQWELEDSTKIFKNYSVQKAKTHFAGRNYTAWFTSEIPIPDGPYLFKGLPGLIVEIYDDQNHYHFKLLSIEKLEEPKTWTLPKNTKKITKEEFQKLLKKEIDLKLENIFNVKDNEGKLRVLIQDREVTRGEFRKILEEKENKKNNPIER